MNRVDGSWPGGGGVGGGFNKAPNHQYVPVVTSFTLTGLPLLFFIVFSLGGGSFLKRFYDDDVAGLTSLCRNKSFCDSASLPTFCSGQLWRCNNDTSSVSLTFRALFDGSIKARSVCYFWPDWSIKAGQIWADSMLTPMTVVELHLRDGQHLIYSPDMISHRPRQLENCHPRLACLHETSSVGSARLWTGSGSRIWQGWGHSHDDPKYSRLRFKSAEGKMQRS